MEFLSGTCFLRIRWTSVSPGGGVELHFDVEKGHHAHRLPTGPQSRAVLEALAERLQGCWHRADVLQQTGEALVTEYPDQGKRAA